MDQFYLLHYYKYESLKRINVNRPVKYIKEKSPALLERIKDNEEEFVKYLSLPITNEDIEIYKKNFKYDRELFKGDKEENKLGKVEINLNKKESSDINKLKELVEKLKRNTVVFQDAADFGLNKEDSKAIEKK